jgi:hypothetical protein
MAARAGRSYASDPPPRQGIILIFGSQIRENGIGFATPRRMWVAEGINVAGAMSTATNYVIA